MARRRHTPEQIVRKLKEADRMLNEGADVAAVARHLQVTEATYHRWRNQYGGHEGRRRQAAEGAREGERPAEAVGRRQGAREPGLAGDRRGKMVSPSQRRRAASMLSGAARPLAATGVPDRRPAPLHPAPPAREPRPRQGPTPPSSGASPVAIPAGAIGGPMPCSAGRATTSTARKSSVCGVKRASGSRPGATSAASRRLDHAGRPARATHPDHVWALDYQFDVTARGRTIKILHITDEYTRESLSDLVAYSIDADATVADARQDGRPAGTSPRLHPLDNGPELTAYALRDWCRFSGAGTSYIDPGIPWQNPWVESYGSRMRDELLSIEQFDTLLEAQVLVADWQEEYNTYRPHSALGMLTPTEFAERWRTNQLQLT